ncbi:hypothetical protein [Devosia lacusdianchii]|uniref:hypothetical protein n=1 Tax=Devosia lacusdianchii TaxID=2917991 RepID=UPI001F06E4CF|nr:hypothetical protein [Devosia sp. JXJ CY 41]
MKPARLAMMATMAALVALPTPAWALFCSNEGPSAGYIVVEDNGKSRMVKDVEGQARLDKQRLREVGVVATSTERWNGCIRAYVTQPEGGQVMEFYDPATLRRLQ